MDFTVEESNLICIYADKTRTGTAANLLAGLPFIDDPDMRELAASVLRKLDAMTDADFAATEFDPVYSTAFSEDEHGL